MQESDAMFNQESTYKVDIEDLMKWPCIIHVGDIVKKTS